MVTRRDQRGVALIFVLWLLVLLGVIIAEVASKARAEAALPPSLRSATVARLAAGSRALPRSRDRRLPGPRGGSVRHGLERRAREHQLGARARARGAARPRGGGTGHRRASRGR